MGYVRAIERVLAERAGRPFVLSPRDFARVSDWYARGIPLGLVLEALHETAGREGAARQRRGAGLGSVARAVEEAWEAVRDGRVLRGAGSEAEPLPRFETALGTWRRVLAEAAEGSPMHSLLGRLLALSDRGSSPQELDASLDAEIAFAAPPPLVARVEGEADRELAPFRKRMAPAVFEATFRRSVVDRLRRALDLPRLALTRDTETPCS